MDRRLIIIAVFVVALGAAGLVAIAGKSGGGSSSSSANATKPDVKVPNGPPPSKLVVKDIKEGDGAAAQTGDQLSVQYVGVIYDTGKEFDSSWESAQPFPPFQLGSGQVIPGWDKGIPGMKVGGRRELIIPPDLAYGKQGSPPDIPPNATLIFVIDLVSIG